MITHNHPYTKTSSRVLTFLVVGSTMMIVLFLLIFIVLVEAASADASASADATPVVAAGTTAAAASAAQRRGRRLNNNNDLSTIWTIPEPSLSYSQTTNNLQLIWNINDIIEDTQVEFTFWDSDCQVGGGSTISPTGTGYSITTSPPATNEPVGDGSSTRQFTMDLSIQIPQITLNNNPKLYFSDESQDRFKMCVRLGLSTPSSEFPQEVNWSETLVDLNFDLLNQGFELSDAVDVYPPECKFVEFSW